MAVLQVLAVLFRCGRIIRKVLLHEFIRKLRFLIDPVDVNGKDGIFPVQFLFSVVLGERYIDFDLISYAVSDQLLLKIVNITA